METKVMRWGRTALRVALGALFIYAGALKSLDPAGFIQSIENYRILPHIGAVALAYFLPYLEIFCGVALTLKRLETGALALLGGLMLVFIGALLSAWVRDLDIACGCLGAGESKADYPLALGRDLALLAALGFLAWRSESGRKS